MPLSPTSWPGSSGSGVGPSCALTVTAPVDIHAAGVHACNWDTLVDDVVSFTPLAAIPSGLALAFAFDGTSGVITTTAAGVWSFTTTIAFVLGADATIRCGWENQLYGSGMSFGPTVTTSPFLTLTEAFALPSGAGGGYRFNTTTPATANPYTALPILAISRLA